MKIHVDKIPQEGLEVRELIDPSKLVLDFDRQDITFIEPIDVKVNFTKTSGELFADVILKTKIEYTCARCLAKIQDVLDRKFSLNYEAKPCGILDIDEDLRQEIILGCPMKVVCKEDCRGLCPSCGQNLNITNCECNNKVR